MLFYGNITLPVLQCIYRRAFASFSIFRLLES